MECRVLWMKKMDFYENLGIIKFCKYMETEMKTLLWVVTRLDRRRLIS